MKKVFFKSLEKFKTLTLNAEKQKNVKGGTDSDSDIVIEDTVEG